MNAKRTKLDWMYGLQWLGVCFLGVAVGGTLSMVSMWTVGAAVEEALGAAAGGRIAGGLFGALIALGANIGPGLLLQQKGLSAARWIIHSAVAGSLGTGVGFGIALGLFDTLSEGIAVVVIGLSLGLPVGIAQWLNLRKLDRMPDSAVGLWPLISVSAYLLGALAPIRFGSEGAEWLVIIILGLVVGSITGLGMVWLFRRPMVLA